MSTLPQQEALREVGVRSDDRVVTVALAGAGNRGQAYISWVHENPHRARLVAVADPLSSRRDIVTRGDSSIRQFSNWQEMAAEPQLADMIIIATQDTDHVAPTHAFAKAGYAILVEKPLAPTPDECREILDVITEAGVMFGVCHVLRYTPYTNIVKSIIDSGELGSIMDIQHLEPVGWWHAAHSYVRGNWRKSAQSSPMLLAKSCHDIDWMRYIAGKRISHVASFGELTHFTRENQPTGASDRCITCAVERQCPYSAIKLYQHSYDTKGYTWPVSVIADSDSQESLDEALATGPYGRCVYTCDNDVVDHQSVLLKFEGGTQATFTMTAFSEQTHRQTRIFGTHGYLECDGETIRVVDFRTGASRTLTADDQGGANAADGHGGGDAGLMDAYVRAVATGNPEHIRSGAIESLESHLAVFAAEDARHSRRITDVPTY